MFDNATYARQYLPSVLCEISSNETLILADVDETLQLARADQVDETTQPAAVLEHIVGQCHIQHIEASQTRTRGHLMHAAAKQTERKTPARLVDVEQARRIGGRHDCKRLPRLDRIWTDCIISIVRRQGN